MTIAKGFIAYAHDDAANVFLLLISSDFVASDFINTHELPAIEKRRKAGALE